MLSLPVVELAPYLSACDTPEARTACTELADSLLRTGLCIVRDPRVTEAHNDAFLNMLEAYFEQPEEALDADVRPHLFFQVGRTPSRVELPRNHCARFKAAAAGSAPLTPCPPEKDAKQRFFWRVGSPPASSAFPQLNAAPVVPSGFPAWSATMDAWGEGLLGATTTVASMLASGLGLPQDALTSMMHSAPHLLAPTASDLRGPHGALGTVLAGVHYDLNAISMHGRSRFPGLYVWTREGARCAVAVPPGCLLVQAGKQLEHVTGGAIQAGFHEVVVDERTLAAVAAAAAAGRSRVRISSTLFGHFASDVLLRPLGRFGEDAAAREAYPPILCGAHVQEELKAINLGEGSSAAQ